MRKNTLFIVIVLSFIDLWQAMSQVHSDTIPAILEKQLDEVQITEKKTARSLSVFKVIDIDSKPSVVNFTTAAMLQQMPSLSADIEGNVRLRSSNKVSLLFQGIPLTLFEENRGDLLIQMPTELFASILVFNMLPTSGVNEGEAGAIDFTFSPEFSDKSKYKMTIASGTDNRYNTSFLAGSKIGKFKWQVGYDFRKEYRYRTYQKTTIDKTGTALMNNNAGASPRTHLAMLDAQYLFSPSDIFDFTALFQRMSYDRLGNINNTKRNVSGVIVANVLRQRNNSEKQTGTSEGLTWKHLWKEQNADFEAILNYDNFDYRQANNFANKKPGTETILAQDRLFITLSKHQWFTSVKLSKQFSKSIAGKIGYIGQLHNDSYDDSYDDLANAVWIHNASKSNTYALIRNLNTGYAEFDVKNNLWYYAGGVQVQFDNRRGTPSGSVGSIKQNSCYLLPHLEVSYQLSPFSLWAIRYQERVNRPFLNDLNPFVDSSDATYIHQGNSELRNERVHSAELSNTLRLQTVTFNPVLFYRYRYNQIVDIAQVGNGSTIWTKENANHSQDIGLEMNVDWKPINFILANISTTGYHYEIDGTRQGYGMRGKYAIDAKGNITFNILHNVDWSLYGYYTDRQLTVQGEIAALGSIGSSLAYTPLKKHLILALSIDNILNSIEEKTTFKTMGSQQTIYRNRDARVIWINASYQF